MNAPHKSTEPVSSVRTRSTNAPALPANLPKYDSQATYDENYASAADPVAIESPPTIGSWRFCGLPVGSPLGMPAGPLLNGRWCLYYASLGFDVVTYKTVRSGERPCYPMPNLQPVACGMLRGGETDLPVAETMRGSWAVSFGMPSKHPEVWRADIAATRRELPSDKVLSVSVVGTEQPGWTLDDLAVDYARCAAWAADAGADTIEVNFSCPNVATCDGQLYQQPADAALVAKRVRESIGDKPLIAKIGHITTDEQARCLIDSLAPFVQALSMTNSIAATIRAKSGELLFDGQRRGICGDACRAGSIEQTARFARLVRGRERPIDIIGVGGISSVEHVREYLDAGATAVQIATAAMTCPAIALEIREKLALSNLSRNSATN